VGAVRIGFVSDTHEADDPLAVIEQLRGLQCDWNIHLGDIGGSPTSRRLVREFKEDGRILERLSVEERARYDTLVQQGQRDILAWLQVTTGNDPQAAAIRRQETADSYYTIIAAMSLLPNHLFLAGNVEHITGRGPMLAEILRQRHERLIVEPEVLSTPEGTIILWPSAASKLDTSQLVDLAGSLRRQIHPGGPVIMASHEQIFKGPTPVVYRRRVETTGRPPASIPFYEPNTARFGMLRLLRQLPPTTPMVMVHGHIHDTCEVIAAGAPYLRDGQGAGLAVRLYGLSHQREERSQQPAGVRRRVPSYCVPAGRVVEMAIGEGSYNIRTLPPPSPSMKLPLTTQAHLATQAETGLG
jgi:hypothetical protein